jgi:hypothetical protein
MVGGVDIERMKRLFHQYPNASLSADEFCAVMSQARIRRRHAPSACAVGMRNRNALGTEARDCAT